MSVDSLILSFRTMFNPNAAEDLRASYELHLKEESFRAEVADGDFKIRRGDAEEPDAFIETDPATLAAMVYDGRSLAEALRSGDIEIKGDVRVVERFLTLFPLPEPAQPVARA